MLKSIRRLFKLRKSAGVRVAAATHLLIKRGDAARNAHHWAAAATAYRAALACEPSLNHIRIQLAHMLKHVGALDEASAIYADAARISVDDAEPLIHQAHLAKRRSSLNASTRLFLSALARGDWQGEAERELRDVLGLTDSIPFETLRSMVQAIAQPSTGDETPFEAVIGGTTVNRPLMFDVTDLIKHFRHRRLPTGIQRVQIEVLESVLSAVNPASVHLCCFTGGRDGAIEIAGGHFRQLIALARAGSGIADPEWQEARARLFLRLALADRLTMPFRAALINLGTSLGVADYFLFVRNAKAQQQISYFPFVHDLIPFIMPEYCVPGIRKEFSAWLAGLFQHADGFLVSSRSTAHDLQEAATYLGHDIAPQTLMLVPLDAGPRFETTTLPASILAKWGLQETTYALMVSTIEPRKNHVLAFDAWAELIRRHGAAVVPRLVCVGRNGWLNDHIFARLAADPALIAAITIIQSISDAELALLYQYSCFTLYPSLYEGWGLPITESLSYCKVPVIANNSSLPEAGGGLALLFESNSVVDLVLALEKVAFDHDWRSAQERRIPSEFKKRSWSDVAKQILDMTQKENFERQLISSPIPRKGIYYPVTLHAAETVWPGLTTGEMFRIGEGWLWAEPEGCRTTSQGGVLRLHLAPADSDEKADTENEDRWLYLRLRGLASSDCAVTISATEQVVHAAIPAGATVWVPLYVRACTAPTMLVTIRGDLTEEVMLSIGGRDAYFQASIAVVGLLMCDCSDESANQRAIRNIDSWREF